jgi:hypothetical protein
MMYFVPSESPARADGSGLAPHRCSFTDQVPGNTGSNIVLFEGTEAQGQIVARSLESADVFWRFLGKRNESGYFEATMNEQWQPVGNTTSNISAVRFIRLRVTPGTRNVVFTFEGPPDAAPRVMVVNGPLQKLPGGTYRSEGAPLPLKAVRNSDIRNSGLVQFIAASDQHHDPQASDEWLTMGPGKHYHYFIFEKGSTSRQEGTFTTLAEFSPAVEATLQPERADPPVNQAVLAPANSAPIPAKSQLPGR